MTEITRTRECIQASIDALGYDFNAFEMEGFLKHVETVRKRPLIVRYVPFSHDLFGLWYPTERVDYIFVNANLHATHQIHTLLHEVAHMLLEHRGTNLRDFLGPDLVRELDISTGDGHLRAAGSLLPVNDRQEREAELFVLLIQRKLVMAQRLHELYGEPTSIAAMHPYVRGLDFNS